MLLPPPSSQRRLRDFLSSRPPAFSYSVSILDLDPKPFDSIPRQLRLDQKIVSCYLRTGGALPKGSLPPLPGIFTAAEREDCTLLFHPVWAPWRQTDATLMPQTERRDAMLMQRSRITEHQSGSSETFLQHLLFIQVNSYKLRLLLLSSVKIYEQEVATKSPHVWATFWYLSYWLRGVCVVAASDSSLLSGGESRHHRSLLS